MNLGVFSTQLAHRVSYLNALELGKRKPSTELIPQLAQVLELPEDALYFSLGLLPPDIRATTAPYLRITDALANLRQTLAHSHPGLDGPDVEIKGEEGGTGGIERCIDNQTIAEMTQHGNMTQLESLMELGLETPAFPQEKDVLLAAPPINNMDSFARLIKKARKARRLRLANVATQLLKTNGRPVSVSFLNNLEQGSRKPSAELIPQLAQALKLPKDLLYFTLGLLPPDIKETEATRQQIADALADLRQTLMFSHHGLEEQAG